MAQHIRSPASAPENLSSLPAGKFSARPLISPQIEHINLVEFLLQCLAESILGIDVQIAPVRYERYYPPPFFFDNEQPFFEELLK